MASMVEEFRAFDVVIDATGKAPVVQSLPLVARHGARILYRGVTDESDLVSISPL